MGIAQNTGGSSRTATYAKLIGGENAGFRIGEKSHGAIFGSVVSFYVKEELTFEASRAAQAAGQIPHKMDLSKVPAKDKHYVGLVRLRDPNPQEDDIVVQFPLEDSLGGKVVGILNTMRLEGALVKGNSPSISLGVFYRAPGTQYNDGVKGKTSINAWPTGMKRALENYIKPTFMTVDGSAILKDPQDPTKNGGLPMGEKMFEGTKNEFWDQSARDSVVYATASVVAKHIADMYAQNDAESDAESDGVSFDEAAAAAAPGQA